MDMKTYALIVAGGKGVRMGGELPKQFLSLAGKPLLMHTIQAFYAYDPAMQIILVLPSTAHAYWEKLCREHSFSVPHQIAFAGETRFHSVKNGLNFVETPGLVGVHDGVRPLVSPSLIARCYELAKEKRAVIPVVDVVETLRRQQGEESVTVDRNEYKLVQTPQVFDAALLLRAYKQPYLPHFTDDASVVEALGESVYLTEGSRDNIKITTPFDLKMATALWHLCSI